MTFSRILFPFPLLLLFATAAIARVELEPLSDAESRQVLQQIDRGEMPAVSVLVRALSFPHPQLRPRAAELLGHVQVGSLDEWYALYPLLLILLFDDPSPDGPDLGMATAQWWAHASLQRISGKDFEYRWEDSLPARRAAMDRWRDWVRQRRIALLLAHPEFELPPTITPGEYVEKLPQYYDDVSPLAAFWERARDSSGWEMGALGSVLLGAILLVGIPWLAPDRRRAVLLFALSATLGVSGYAYYDREYLVALYHIRDVQTVREDCARLLKTSRTLGGMLDLSLGDPAFPESFHALGIVFVDADDYTVAFQRVDADGRPSYYHLLYDPEGLRAGVRMTYNRSRPTLWKGMYLVKPPLRF